jgi:hypothetical protein
MYRSNEVLKGMSWTLLDSTRHHLGMEEVELWRTKISAPGGLGYFEANVLAFGHTSYSYGNFIGLLRPEQILYQTGVAMGEVHLTQR